MKTLKDKEVNLMESIVRTKDTMHFGCSIKVFNKEDVAQAIKEIRSKAGYFPRTKQKIILMEDFDEIIGDFEQKGSDEK